VPEISMGLLAEPIAASFVIAATRSRRRATAVRKPSSRIFRAWASD
jgi:hypothetical protein